MGGPGLKKSISEYGDEDILDLSEKDFFGKFYGDNRGFVDLGKESRAKQQDLYKTEVSRRREAKRAGREKELTQQQTDLRNLLTARPGSTYTNLLT